MQRITITLDDDLVEQFEEFRKLRGYSNRSEAFRDLVRERLESDRLANGGEGECLAALTYVYNHHQRDLATRMTELSHAHHDLTVSTLHVHLSHHDCMETAVLRGPIRRVRAFANAAIAQPGVRHGKLYVLPIRASEEAHHHGDAHQPHRHLHLKPMT
ncbi:MAG: nickel-responsive transcriptional regulator NikR [Chromatiaceae bacterium]|jgi:CopG family nickel-responsive transcriptional regulator